MNVIRNMILDVLPDVWPIIIIITVIVSTLRIAYLIKNKEKFCFHRELYCLIFILYVLCLFEVVTFQDVSYGTSNFIPFKEIFRYKLGSRLFIKNIIGNILLFLPYGFFVSDFLKLKKPSHIIILTLTVSATIEYVQSYIGRTIDIDDVILNVLGGFIGFTLYLVIEAIKNKLPEFLKKDGVVDFFVILLIVVIIVYSFNLNAFSWFNYN